MADIQHQVLPNGSRIGVYEIRGVQLISHFSIIYKGWNHHLSTTMAVEEYLPLQFAIRAKDGRNVEPKSDDDRTHYDFGLTKFVEQAENLMKIEHPNVGGVHNVLQVNGTAYLAMDYEDGLPLTRLCDNRQVKFDEDELKVIFIPVLKALQEVHKQGFFHGAVIPANILLRKDGEPVLVNFAAARLALASRSGTLPMILSKGYAPIEQYKADSQYGPWTDLYTLGATIYHCISGNTPKSAPERISAINNDAPDPQPSLLQTESTQYSDALLKAIDSMLAVQIEHRPSSAAAILAALDADFEPSTSKEPPAYIKAETPDLDRVGHAPVPPQSEKNIRQHLLLGGGFGLVVAMLVVASLWYFGQNGHRADTMEFNGEGQSFASKQGQTTLSSGTTIHPTRQATRSEPRNSEQAVGYIGNTRDANESVQTMANARNRPPYPSDYAESSPAPSGSSENDISVGEFVAKPAQGPLTSQETASVKTDPEKLDSSNAWVSAEPKSTAEVPSTTGYSVREPAESETEPEPTPSFTSLPEPEKNLAFKHATQAPGDAVTQQDVIEQHMAVAEQHLAALRLSTPPGENALEHFQAVLSLAPDHPGARQGLEQIAIRYGWLIDKAIKEREFPLAHVYLDRAKKALPDLQNLQVLRTELESAEAAAQNYD